MNFFIWCLIPNFPYQNVKDFRLSLYLLDRPQTYCLSRRTSPDIWKIYAPSSFLAFSFIFSDIWSWRTLQTIHNFTQNYPHKTNYIGVWGDISGWIIDSLNLFTIHSYLYLWGKSQMLWPSGLDSYYFTKNKIERSSVA